MTTFKDLADQSEVAYGVKKYGANLPLFHDGPVVTKMFNYMDANPSTFVKGEKEAVNRVKTSKYAFITEAPFNEYIVNRDCELTVIDDKQKNFQFEYAIAMRKDLIERYVISDALKHMKKNGILDQLKDKYWKTDKCVEDSNVQEISPNVLPSRLSRDDKEWKDHGHKSRKSHKYNKGSAAFNKLSHFLLGLLLIILYMCR